MWTLVASDCPLILLASFMSTFVCTWVLFSNAVCMVFGVSGACLNTCLCSTVEFVRCAWICSLCIFAVLCPVVFVSRSIVCVMLVVLMGSDVASVGDMWSSRVRCLVCALVRIVLIFIW